MLHLSSIGCARIPKASPYPPQKHPADRAFTWERGRVLPALQVLALTHGAGVLEIRGRRFELPRGSVVLLPPRVWHRYRPDRRSGWTEQWLEIRGPAVESWMEASMLDRDPVQVPFEDAFWSHFEELHRICSERPLGYRAVAAGLAMSLVARVVSRADAAEAGAGEQLDDLARKVRALLAEGHEVAQIAALLGISTATLLRRFKRATGLGPKRYATELRLARAESLLAGGDLSVKEVAARLGYHSASHLSLEFKRMRGRAPSEVKPGAAFSS